METKNIGTIVFDSGLLWVGDPAYMVHKDSNELPESFGKDWEEFVDNIGSDPVASFGSEDLDDPKSFGLAISTGDDGQADVQAEVDDNGTVQKVIIDLTGVGRGVDASIKMIKSSLAIEEVI